MTGGDTLWGPGVWKQMLSSEPWFPHSSCVTLGKLLSFSESHFLPYIWYCDTHKHVSGSMAFTKYSLDTNYC